MISSTYGVLPTKEQFDKAFEVQCPEGFKVGNDKLYGNHTFSCEELWSAVLHRTKLFLEEGDDISGDWASCVLYCLGFEWV